MVEAEWSGAYPWLCYGTWTLKVNGVDVSDKIPEHIRDGSMNTYGTYGKWYFDEDGYEEFDSYSDGLEEDDWIKENDIWLNTITTDYKVKQQIFAEIQSHDFRTGSCGGCI